jgi:uncharacterized protein YprB with RNaseH-like and TPR domain
MRSFDPDAVEPEFDPDAGAPADTVAAYKEQLRRDFDGLPFETVLPGSLLEGEFGACWQMTETRRGGMRRGSAERVRTGITANLDLVRGIRRRTRDKLAEQGIESLADLADHPRFGEESKRIREALDRGDSAELAGLLGTRLPRSHPQILELSGLHPDTDFLFLDLETMGLHAGQPIVVAGVATLDADNVINLGQYVVRDFPDELPLVAELKRLVESHPVLVTYNGKAFDLPILTGRCVYYGLTLEWPAVHFDLLHFCRRAWKDELDSCSLGTIERAILGAGRDTDLPGEFVPEFYHEYLWSRNAGFLKPIVDHNRQDVASLVNVFSSLLDRWQDKGA